MMSMDVFSNDGDRLSVAGICWAKFGKKAIQNILNVAKDFDEELEDMMLRKIRSIFLSDLFANIQFVVNFAIVIGVYNRLILPIDKYAKSPDDPIR